MTDNEEPWEDVEPTKKCPDCGGNIHETEDSHPELCCTCQGKKIRAGRKALREKMPGNLFIMRDDEYGYLFITDCPVERIKELAKESIKRFHDDGDYGLDEYTEERFAEAGYMIESLFDVVDSDFWFESDD
jgi:hypothetical protein